MKMFIKLSILSVLLFSFTGGLKAQEKYEFAIVSLNMTSMVVAVSENGETYQETTVPKADKKGLWDYNSLLKKVLEMQDKGWEVFSTGKADNLLLYHLRKKK